jgi:hypothetical protein
MASPSISEQNEALRNAEHYAAFSPDEEVRVKCQHIAAVLRWVLGMPEGHNPNAVTLVMKDHQPPYYTRR